MKRPARPVRSPEGPLFTVFLDRDGVLNRNPRMAVRSWSEWEWIPGAKEALASLNQEGIQLCLATNQPTVGMGLTRRSAIEAVHAQALAEIEAAGGRLDRLEAAWVPWSRRYKPRPGMLEDGAAAFAKAGTPVDKRRAVMVGDKPKDALAAAAFGIPAILVATTYPREELQVRVARLALKEVCIVDDITEAAQEILSRVEDVHLEADHGG